jgi:hypothetical protein
MYVTSFYSKRVVRDTICVGALFLAWVRPKHTGGVFSWSLSVVVFFREGTWWVYIVEK